MGAEPNIVVTAPPALLRPSQLARFWELNPRTLHVWIREGRLPAIRSPGNHFRLRIADVRAFCEREGLPVPPFVSPPSRRVVVGAAPLPLRRAVSRAIRAAAVLHAFADRYEALVAAVAERTEIFATSAQPGFDAVAAARALTGTPATSHVTVVAFDVPTRAQAVALEKAGAARAILEAKTGELLPGILADLLGRGE
jgi:excisionase family DNA binding protein